ncbi:serine hydrolase [Bacillus spongiae]|uniref:Serine hydrolase n=1 Tax=Bacillus spongiae TaxID=2683610 RepID=A0ABU8HDY1_9BACI
MNKKILIFCLFLITPFILPHHTQANESLALNADAAILVEADTGKILYKQNEDQPLGIASMTKMMTEYLVLEAIHTGKISWDDTYTASEKVYTLANTPGLSNVPLQKGEAYSVKELYEAMVIKSANGASIALSEMVGGSEGEFVEMMNEKAETLNLKHYQFVNSTGLSNEDMMGLHPEGTGLHDENMLSAQDTATLAYHLIRDFPEVLETASLPTKTFREGTAEAFLMENTNIMLKGFPYAYEGMDGLKTGTTPFAGPTFTGTALKNGIRYITVIMNAKDDQNQPSSIDRFLQTTQLLDYGFNEHGAIEFTLDDYQSPQERVIQVSGGKVTSINYYSDETLNIRMNLTKKDKMLLNLVMDEEKLTEEGKLKAPVEKGEKIGEMTLQHPSTDEYIIEKPNENYRINVYAAESVKEESWITRFFRSIQELFKKFF